MAKDKIQAKDITEKELDEKVRELKIEMLKQPQKSKGIRREIARMLTIKTMKDKLKPKKTKIVEANPLKKSVNGEKESKPKQTKEKNRGGDLKKKQ
jgi:ribosomal protein L29